MPSPWSTLPVARPLETAWKPFAVVTKTSYVALSVGTLLTGNQPWEPSGSPSETAPYLMFDSQPSDEPSGSITGLGGPP